MALCNNNPSYRGEIYPENCSLHCRLRCRHSKFVSHRDRERKRGGCLTPQKGGESNDPLYTLLYSQGKAWDTNPFRRRKVVVGGEGVRSPTTGLTEVACFVSGKWTGESEVDSE